MKKILLLSFVCVLASCRSSSTAQLNPDSLIDSTSEKVTFSITDKDSVDNVKDWISSDSPASATITCDKQDKICSLAEVALKERSIPYQYSTNEEGDGSVVLSYARVAARDCTNTDFGCSVSANSVQMVSNRMQFVNPALSDPQDALTAVNAYRKYLKH